MAEIQFGNPETEDRVLKLLRENNGQPVSTGWMAEKLGVCWSTARIVLLDLARQGKIEMFKSSIGWLFCLTKQHSTSKDDAKGAGEIGT